MARLFYLFPLFFFVLGCAVAEKQSSVQSNADSISISVDAAAAAAAAAEAGKKSVIELVLNEVSTNKFKSIMVLDRDNWDITDPAHFIPSFEATERVCKGFDLTEADVREFFQKAQLWTEKQKEYYETSQPKSRCYVNGDIQLQNGTVVTWQIDKARNGYILFADNSEGETVSLRARLFCEKCTSEKFYPRKWDGFRPIVKSVTIKENGIPYIPEEAEKEFAQKLYKDCEKSKLSKANVIEYFKAARPATRTEYLETPFSLCSAKGAAVLGNGKKVNWRIKSNRYGSVSFGNGIEIYYYCHDCNPRVFEKDCDLECEMNGRDE